MAVTVVTTATLPDARSNLVRERVLDGVFEVLAAGDDLTFAKVAKAAGVPERTIYRHFPSKEALHAAIWTWANERMGFTGPFPTDEARDVTLVRRVHPGFERLAPVIRELLASKDGLEVRLTANDQRRQSALTAVAAAAPGLGATDEIRVAEAVPSDTGAST
jgi:AcrR family transcriptional regulator